MSAQKAALSTQAREALGLGSAQQAAGAAGRGTLGSARQRLAQAQAEESAGAQLASKFADLEQQDLAARRSAQQGAVGQTGAVQAGQAAGAETLGKIGGQIQQQRQKEADQAFTALQRQGQLLGAATAGQGTTTQTGPAQGGK